MDKSTFKKQKNLEDVLSKRQVECVIRKMLDNKAEWRVTSSEVKPAADGMTGFLGDHLRVTLNVAAGDARKTIQLFIKRMPLENPPKVALIEENNFFKRERLLCDLLDEFQSDDDLQPWCIKTLICSDSLVVMPDVRPLGYTSKSPLEPLDLPHLLLTAGSVARFHAATANYENKKILRNNKPWTFSQEYAEMLHVDPSFRDSPWLRACAKLVANTLKVFCNKYNDKLDFEAKIITLFVKACESLKEYESTLNVLLHKDLWISNIMFRYENSEPVEALLIDYQCLRYGPPAFDLMILLYCTTYRTFREQHELTVLRHYFSVFSENIDDATERKLNKLGYDEKEFLEWCKRARFFAAMQASALFPFILMDPITAQKIYDDPDTFEELMIADRTKPVVEYCHQKPVYKERLIEVFEEFVERYYDEE
ncbi:uncharacterized protein LOC128674774 [Plodia interpunctella]|uniref:uncharacterized protein LOC128674774 n=1 Tax=Plodia interpunctella TaxID=58824 RepID=UPI0023676E62|nr:uncharacterized protein LOC128674774 [Plodia interpunctella]